MQAAEAVRSFARCREGTVALLFALSLPALLGGMGLAVDFAAVTRQQAVVQSAADSAALNAARELIIAEPTITRVQAVAQRTVDAILAEKGKKADWTVSTSLVDANKSVVVKVTRPLKPMFQKVYAFLGSRRTRGWRTCARRRGFRTIPSFACC